MNRKAFLRKLGLGLLAAPFAAAAAVKAAEAAAPGKHTVTSVIGGHRAYWDDARSVWRWEDTGNIIGMELRFGGAAQDASSLKVVSRSGWLVAPEGKFADKPIAACAIEISDAAIGGATLRTCCSPEREQYVILNAARLLKSFRTTLKVKA